MSSLRYCFYPELQEKLNSFSESSNFLRRIDFVFQQRVAFTISLPSAWWIIFQIYSQRSFFPLHSFNDLLCSLFNILEDFSNHMRKVKCSHRLTRQSHENCTDFSAIHYIILHVILHMLLKLQLLSTCVCPCKAVKIRGLCLTRVFQGLSKAPEITIKRCKVDWDCWAGVWR